MKNAFKFGFAALAITLSVAACTSEKKVLLLTLQQRIQVQL
jgi:hypothetical protein